MNWTVVRANDDGSECIVEYVVDIQIGSASSPAEPTRPLCSLVLVGRAAPWSCRDEFLIVDERNRPLRYRVVSVSYEAKSGLTRVDGVPVAARRAAVPQAQVDEAVADLIGIMQDLG